MSETQKQPKWLRAYGQKLKNRRVRVDLFDNGGYLLSFKRLMPDRTVKKTQLELTEEAMEAVIRCVLAIAEREGPVGSIAGRNQKSAQ